MFFFFSCKASLVREDVAQEKNIWSKISPVVESKLKAIFESGEFNARQFRGEWCPDGSAYALLERNSKENGMELVSYEILTGKRTVLAGPAQLIPSGQQKPLLVENYALSPDGAFILIQTNSRTDEETGKVIADYWLLKRKTGQLTKIASEVDIINIKRCFSPDSRKIIVSLKDNLYVYEVDTGRKICLTTDGVANKISNDNAVWSPDSKYIAYIQSDSTNVRLRPVLVPVDPTYPKVRYVRFARVGTPIPRLRLGVVKAEGGKTLWFKIGKKDEEFYLRELEWLKNSREISVEKLSRSRDYREFLVAEVTSGKVEKIYQESDPAWVDASYGTNAGLSWIDNDKSFIVISEKDGWRRAYKLSRNKNSKEIPLTPSGVDIISRVGLDEERGWFYYLASPDNATQSYLYRVRLDGKSEPQKVTPAGQKGVHRYALSPDGHYAFHTSSTFDTPPVTELIQLPEHKIIRVLEDNRQLRAKFEAMKFPPVEFLKLDIGNGVVMDAWMIKPRDFNPAKKYPVFVWVYGEPHSQTVLDQWQGARGMFHRVIADIGYLVVSIDNRGTPAPKGAAWRRAVFGSLGPLSTKEQAAGLRELGRKVSYVDLSRVGVWGWSGGGSNTLNAMFREPDLYKVGIAVAPKPQPQLYNAWFQEIYMRTPEVNPQGYKESAPINFAEGLKGHLLIVHGSGETNTHIQITEGLVDRLIALGKQFDYMVYPNRDHGLREGEGTILHLYMLIARYLITHLPPGPR
ncbi:MAG: DPP IV N-terminal domain-containing protein [Candidatus Aminicenantes bacterium]|nr:DPP IV N-terminal domain-containing protein [Candidatus Aminicenantes bacterium]